MTGRHTHDGAAPPTSSPVPVRSAAERDWWVMTGMAVAATSATVASFTGLRGLALLTGWPDHLAWLLPVTVDAYAMTSARVWLAGGHMVRAARRFARANALGAISASIAGNAAYHAVHAGLLEVSWPIIVLVGAVPAAVLGLTAHLHALSGRPDNVPPAVTGPAGDDAGPAGRPCPVPAGEPEPAPANAPTTASPADSRTEATEPEPATPPKPIINDYPSPGVAGPARTEQELFAAALEADHRYRRTHGRPITRDALRTELRISNSRATTVRRRLHDHHASTGAALIPAQRDGAPYDAPKSIVPE